MIETITLRRIFANDACTLGRMNVFGRRVWTLEDPFKEHKVYGDTRIPPGEYRLTLRIEGGMNQRYAARFPDIHKGMIWLQDVPMFEWVYIHIGNSARDTEGCILVGLDKLDNAISKSKLAYKLIYPKIVGAIQETGCLLKIIDDYQGSAYD